ncbi:hypothetical protein F4861DRAFT_142499 [Xylaria intraflava]|nr:hypothetical protein F4861DRAFT_142499 [Xylaria intraflava]
MALENQASSLYWTRSPASTYERGLDPIEKLYHFISKIGQGCPDRDNWRCTACAKITTDLDNLTERLRLVWKQTRFQFPAIAAHIDGDHWVYQPAGAEELESWMQETFRVIETTGTARAGWQVEGVESPRLSLYFFTNTREIVIRGPHTHLDGIGMMTLLKFIMQALVKNDLPVADGTETKNLLPPLAITTKVPLHTPKQKKRFEEAMQHFLANHNGVRVRSENAGAPAGKTKLRWLVYTASETAAIAARCKQLGFSVTACMQAAAGRTARIHGQVSGTRHATMAIYDGRGYIDPSEIQHDRLVGPHVFAMPAVYPISPESFVETALSAKAVLASFREDDLVRSTSDLWSAAARAMLAHAPPPDQPVAADLQLSSLGILDRHLPRSYRSDDGAQVEAEDAWIALDLLNPLVTVEAWTFRDRLNIEIIFNEAYYRDDSISLMATLLHEQLTEGLGLDLAFDLRTPGEEEFTKI